MTASGVYSCTGLDLNLQQVTGSISLNVISKFLLTFDFVSSSNIPPTLSIVCKHYFITIS